MVIDLCSLGVGPQRTFNRSLLLSLFFHFTLAITFITSLHAHSPVMEKYYLFIFLLSLSCVFVHTTVPPAVLKDGTYNYPMADPPTTPGIMPQWGVQLEDGAENVLDLTFGTDIPNATIRSVNELGNVVYFYDLFGDPSQPRQFPVCGIQNNFMGTYSFYNEYLSDNTTRNPLAVHQVLSDRLRLVARTNQSGSLPGLLDTHKFEIGYIRLPIQFTPGMVAELRIAPGGWPTSKWSWPTFWAFPGVQLPLEGGISNRTRWYVSSAGVPLENDFFDGYTVDEANNQGASIPNGTPVYGDGSLYNYTDDLFMMGPGSFSWQGNGGGGSGVQRLNIPPKYDPVNTTSPGLTVLAEWTDDHTLKYYFNGELVRIRYAQYSGAYSNANPGYDYENNPPPDSHQFGPAFNTRDLAELEALKTQVISNYDIQSVRVWKKLTTYQPPTSTPSTTLPPPVTGTALGDLPQISSGTYVMNVEPVNGIMVDHFGAQVNLTGVKPQMTFNNTNMNNRAALMVQNYEGVSITGPAISYAQNGGSFMIFQVNVNRAPSSATNDWIYFQMIRNYPMTDPTCDKPTLLMTPFDKKLSTRLQASSTGDLANSNSSYQVPQNQPILVMLNQSVGIDGTVTVGMGVQNSYYTPAIGKGVPTNLLDGYTELLLGAGRNRYNVLVNGANLLIGQTIMVAFEPGKTLSDTDLSAIRHYLAQKWGVAGINDTLISKNVSAATPQIGSYKPPSPSSFSSVNAAQMRITNPFVLTMQPSTTNNTAMQLLPISNSNRTLTALIQFNIPWASSKTPGKYNSMNGGLVLYDDATEITATFGVYFQNDRSGGYRAYWYLPGSVKNDSWGSEQRKWYAADYRNVWIRLVYSPHLTTLLGSATGRVNEWDQLITTNNSLSYNSSLVNFKPTYIGFYLNTVAPAGFSSPASLSVLHMDDLSSDTNYQGASSLYTSNFIINSTSTSTSSSTGQSTSTTALSSTSSPSSSNSSSTTAEQENSTPHITFSRFLLAMFTFIIPVYSHNED